MSHSTPSHAPAVPARPPRHRAPVRKPPSRPARKKGGPFRFLLPVLLLVVVVAVVLVIRARLQAEPPEEPPAPVTFSYRDRILTALEGVPVSTFDASRFTLDERGRVQYAFGVEKARTGIDVSYSQPDVDWKAVAADGIDFVFLRAGYRGYTEGGLYTDQMFEDHLTGALEAGLDVGVYFFSQAISPEEAEAEADRVLEILDGRKLAYPVAYDWEPVDSADARTASVDNATLTRCAITFCERIKEGGYKPCLYLNQDQAYLSYDLTQLTDYPFWLADYRNTTDFFYDFDFWQYSHTGTVAGIPKPVDLDLDLRYVKD